MQRITDFTIGLLIIGMFVFGIYLMLNISVKVQSASQEYAKYLIEHKF